MARLETVSSFAAKQRRRFLPHALIYPFRIFKLGKSGVLVHTFIREMHVFHLLAQNILCKLMLLLNK